MNVSACLVTRGNVDMQPVLDSLPFEWETVIYDNGAGRIEVVTPEHTNGNRSTRVMTLLPDLSVYGRYAAIEYASHDLIFVCDDDVIVSDPQAIVDAWLDCGSAYHDEAKETREGLLVANMPQEFRHNGYTDSCLVGFGACFHRDLPEKAFGRFWVNCGVMEQDNGGGGLFHRECDRVFTCLTPRVLVDIAKSDREFASDSDRLWRQPEHVGSTNRMLRLAREVRDAS